MDDSFSRDVVLSLEEKTRARLISWKVVELIDCVRDLWENSDLSIEEKAHANLYLDSKVRALLKDENTKPAIFDIYQHFEVQGLDYHERKK